LLLKIYLLFHILIGIYVIL